MELLIVFVVLYFIPTIIAACRSHHNAGAIFALNLLLGWIVIGWIVALIWSLTYVDPGKRPTRPVIAPNLKVVVPVLILFGLTLVAAGVWNTTTGPRAPASSTPASFKPQAASVVQPALTTYAINTDPTERQAGGGASKREAKPLRHQPKAKPDATADSAEAARRAWLADWQRRCAAMPRDEGIATCGKYYVPPRR